MSKCYGIQVVAGLLVSFAAMSSAAAQEDGYIEYVVKKGDTCIKIARKVYGEGDLCYELMAGSNKFDKKFRIYPGQKLKLPTKEQIEEQRQESLDAEADATLPAKSDEPDATLKRFRGDVTARSPEASDWEKAATNKDLWRRWKVNSSSKSSAEVFFVREKATLRMRENTLVVIYGRGTTSSTTSTARHAVLEKGSLSTRLDELSGGGSSVEIETPSAVVTSKDGDTLVNVTEGSTTLVANHTSKSAKVRGSKKSSKRIKLPKNTGSRVEKGKEPSPPRPLPDPPAWSAPDFSAVSMGGKSKITASWGSVTDAAVWRVEVRRAPEDELIDVAVLDAGIREVVFEDFAPGDYTLRIATIDTVGFEGKMSEPVKLKVKEVVLADKDAPVQKRERLASGSLYLGESVALAPDMNCTYGGKSVTNQRVQANHRGFHTLECTDSDGVKMPPQSFSVAPNTATLSAAPEDKLEAGELTEVRFTLEHPLDSVDISYPDGFESGGEVSQLEDGTWVVPVRALKPESEGQLRVGTPGILGATLLKVPLASAEEKVTFVELPPEKPWHWFIGVYSGSRDVTNKGGEVDGRESDQSLLLGLRTGVQWRRQLVLDMEFDTGINTLIRPGAIQNTDKYQSFGLAGALSYRIGPWALKPFVKAGAGIDFVPELSADTPYAMAGGGLLWLVERRVDLRLDVYQIMLLDENDDAWRTGATLGFAATF